MQDSDEPVAKSRKPSTEIGIPEDILAAYETHHEVVRTLWEPLRQVVGQIEAAQAPFRREVAAAQDAVDAASVIPNGLGRFLTAMETESANQARLLAEIGEQNDRTLRLFEQWAKDWEIQERELIVGLEELAVLGWFFDPEMPCRVPIGFARGLQKGDPATVTDAIAEYFRERVDEIEVSLAARYPRRTRILSDAFGAHRERKYNLSVPVFLTQADGLWRDTFSTKLFLGSKSVPAANREANLEEGVPRGFLRLFESSMPLWKFEGQRERDFKKLNRHQVLHGEVVDYGTEHNSLQAISFLGLVNWILEECSSCAQN